MMEAYIDIDVTSDGGLYCCTQHCQQSIVAEELPYGQNSSARQKQAKPIKHELDIYAYCTSPTDGRQISIELLLTNHFYARPLSQGTESYLPSTISSSTCGFVDHAARG